MLLRMLSSRCILEVEKTFLFGNYICVMNGNHGVITLIDTTRFSFNKVHVFYHDVDKYFLLEQSAVLTYNGKVFTWTQSDGFHWRIAPTTGPEPLFEKSLSTTVTNGDSSTSYLVLCHDSANHSVRRTSEPDNDEYAFYLGELNLVTMQWQRSAIVGSNILKKHGWRFSERTMKIVATQSEVHVFTTDGDTEHMTIDRASKNWVKSSNYCVEIRAAFVFQDTLYTFSDDEERTMAMIYRHADGSNRKIGELPINIEYWDNGDMCCMEVHVSGSCVYFVCTYIPNSTKNLDFVLVLNLNPTLCDLALSAVMRNWSTLGRHGVETLQDNLIEHVMSDPLGTLEPYGCKSVQSVNGLYVSSKRVQLRGRLEHNTEHNERPEVDLVKARTMWHIEQSDDDKVNLQSWNSNSHIKYMRAHRDGRVSHDDGEGPSGLWHLIRNRNNTWSFKSVYGQWLSASRGDGVMCTVAHNKITEHFWLEPW